MCNVLLTKEALGSGGRLWGGITTSKTMIIIIIIIIIYKCVNMYICIMIMI